MSIEISWSAFEKMMAADLPTLEILRRIHSKIPSDPVSPTQENDGPTEKIRRLIQPTDNLIVDVEGQSFTHTIPCGAIMLSNAQPPLPKTSLPSFSLQDLNVGQFPNLPTTESQKCDDEIHISHHNVAPPLTQTKEHFKDFSNQDVVDWIEHTLSRSMTASSSLERPSTTECLGSIINFDSISWTRWSEIFDSFGGLQRIFFSDFLYLMDLAPGAKEQLSEYLLRTGIIKWFSAHPDQISSNTQGCEVVFPTNFLSILCVSCHLFQLPRRAFQSAIRSLHYPHHLGFLGVWIEQEILNIHARKNCM
eukprot:TRINITY_DN8273_c0_g1_i2.p1 TRINITY_DN8273_c0_g1~~TRINITY_DN8273_c0_g1_i2.p1  ORF type:complete len:306 (+),score=50.02 TRINITY_DN8273_c0_g1_i2:45-962(+)